MKLRLSSVYLHVPRTLISRLAACYFALIEELRKPLKIKGVRRSLESDNSNSELLSGIYFTRNQYLGLHRALEEKIHWAVSINEMISGVLEKVQKIIKPSTHKKKRARS